MVTTVFRTVATPAVLAGALAGVAALTCTVVFAEVFGISLGEF